MVWSLFPVDPHSGEEKYYIFTKGIYRVGRKGCEIIISKDKGVSRVHAEIIVDEMVSLGRLPGGSNVSSRVRIKDSSKYGTFINKDHQSNEKVHELPSKETMLKDGDVVCFGPSNAGYRFSFLPFVFYCMLCSEPFAVREKASSIGACTTDELSDECTHVLSDHLVPVSVALIDAIVAKKPIVLTSWLELVAEKCIGSEIPSWSSNTPTVAVGGLSVQVVDSITRSKCLLGYSFILDPRQTVMYLFEDRLPSLLEVAGAKTASVEEFCSNSQDMDCGGRNRVICVTTRASAYKFDHITELSSFSRLDEMDLLCAILSGHLDLLMLTRPTVHVSLSSTTDETIVADSDTEAEADTISSVPVDTNVISGKVPSKWENKEERAPLNPTAKRSEETYTVRSVHEDDASMRTKIKKVECEDNGNADIIYSQVLVVRGSNLSAGEANSTINNEVPNFKCFRKKCIQSGNSFSNLVPFSRDPYKESSFDSAEIQASMKEEKKRKQMEAVAEDLFNNERGKKRSMAGSVHGLLSRARARG